MSETIEVAMSKRRRAMRSRTALALGIALLSGTATTGCVEGDMSTASAIESAAGIPQPPHVLYYGKTVIANIHCQSKQVQDDVAPRILIDGREGGSRKWAPPNAVWRAEVTGDYTDNTRTKRQFAFWISARYMTPPTSSQALYAAGEGLLGSPGLHDAHEHDEPIADIPVPNGYQKVYIRTTDNDNEVSAVCSNYVNYYRTLADLPTHYYQVTYALSTPAPEGFAYQQPTPLPLNEPTGLPRP